MVANGDRLSCLGVNEGATFSVHDDPFRDEVFVLLPVDYDLVLGTRWLATLGSIMWDFSTLTMSFWLHDHKAYWQGLGSPPRLPQLAAVGANLMPALLQEFDALFTEPHGLPLPRACNHCIHLLPSMPLVTVRPYC
ncbi:hypothetical protein U9M48_002976 [Paspalum notatum var. saurae]|uniref:Uncharacterized protein n=1 Tax=Paspalum notatum var. saurae TaxID=547442 RepID=A0AAQ3PKE0_PASNO